MIDISNIITSEIGFTLYSVFLKYKRYFQDGEIKKNKKLTGKCQVLLIPLKKLETI